MTCRSFLAASIAFSLAVVPTSAQTFDPATVAPNPMVEGLARSATEGGGLVELQGFVGPSTPETVRLYTDMTFSRYLEIPRQSIVQQVPGATDTKPVKLYTSSATIIGQVTRIPAGDYGDQARLVPNGIGGLPIDPPFRPGGPFSPLPGTPRDQACTILKVECAMGIVAACFVAIGYCSVIR
jgi:hypothetical protein